MVGEGQYDDVDGWDLSTTPGTLEEEAEQDDVKERGKNRKSRNSHREVESPLARQGGKRMRKDPDSSASNHDLVSPTNSSGIRASYQVMGLVWPPDGEGKVGENVVGEGGNVVENDFGEGGNVVENFVAEGGNVRRSPEPRPATTLGTHRLKVIRSGRDT